MRAEIAWTDTLDERVGILREAGMTWDGVAAALGLGRNTVLERARKIGIRGRRAPKTEVQEEPRDRPARQAGHPQTWGMITAGTVLDSERYPYPVFL